MEVIPQVKCRQADQIMEKTEENNHQMGNLQKSNHQVVIKKKIKEKKIKESCHQATQMIIPIRKMGHLMELMMEMAEKWCHQQKI